MREQGCGWGAAREEGPGTVMRRSPSTHQGPGAGGRGGPTAHWKAGRWGAISVWHAEDFGSGG
jgi:hypothetical protein